MSATTAREKAPVASFVAMAVLAGTLIGYFTTDVRDERSDCLTDGGVYVRAATGDPGVNWMGYTCAEPRRTVDESDDL